MIDEPRRSKHAQPVVGRGCPGQPWRDVPWGDGENLLLLLVGHVGSQRTFFSSAVFFEVFDVG